ncbi:MAG: YiiX/YebB-like N1pC/P60 family cysteine hydrolase [candidate division KSB1 bacterium]|nr:YiiX/YebB-like N1pC/P60 family cysteine hydrolase [candidate division KSB1 bacterium]MDZ7275643.1 YiiX/YebB-like N1pC/P60 family cysteine hydrolase [candidate division KSB1 bacterium]MDZ7284666.1 YiiX/YebB-like N1pC/P60 family cysteine hydrolase [candidate division KSB1 bacterium]MDZ7297915.1 YiiX/YebB-like N1pC/P60 family cysteine hydrolase [candidate division KSB1 bacterium]MDZ7307120.1 YiiX/YebB-like N1pC/P60 family cysteine hydrolase [candidate division KSB1 bacterium]
MTSTIPSGRRKRRFVAYPALALGALYLILLLPAAEAPPPVRSDKTPFVWNRDAYWQALEERFNKARTAGGAMLEARLTRELARTQQRLDSLTARSFAPEHPLLTRLERDIFELAPQVAACPEKLAAYERLHCRVRALVKRQSQQWDIQSPATRDRLYRLLYGSRAALEEVMLQAPPQAVPALTRGEEEPSQTPSTKILGVTIHSGDILVSRGGAPTSALIARGNDYPGNFSHIALVHVDEKTSLASIIEAHIERGVAVATLEEYLRDKKLRVMVLRLRADLPALLTNPGLPHEAAGTALARAKTQHIPYDFEMDYEDPGKLFCSEVASRAYRQCGIQLWMGISHISSPGVGVWLAAFGVRHFQTQEPADLEYDPQLRVVAEWRDPETLYHDHIDNAVTDAMLEKAEAGDRLNYAWYLLPLARILKGYSLLCNALGQIGPVPEGMSAAAALRHRQFNQRHLALKARVLQQAEQFVQQHGYRPPYWELVAMARAAAVQTAMSPAQPFHANSGGMPRGG